MPDPLDAVRAEGRRLLARVTVAANPIAETGALARLGLFVQAHPALLADPAPEEPVPCCHPSSTGIDQTDGPEKVWRCDACGWLHIHTLGDDGLTRSSAAPAPEGVPEDRLVPDGWRVEWQVTTIVDRRSGAVRYSDAPVLVPLSDTPHEEGEQP